MSLLKAHGFLLIFILMLLCARPLPAGTLEQHRYLHQTGSNRHYFDWQLLDQGEALLLQTEQGQEHTQTRLNNELSTLSWQIQNPRINVDLKVERTDNTLQIKGLFQGDPVEQVVEIDSAPWLQALSISLRRFIDPAYQTIQFWTLRPDTLETHRLQVSRQGVETLNIAGIDTRAIKLKVELTGWKALFWSSYYWLREEDGVFLRYQGRNGPPGQPLTTIELIDSPANPQ